MSEPVSRRGALSCMAWAGTGVLWTLAGGVPRSIGLLDEAAAATLDPGAFTFLQMSDSHVGFSKPANPDATATLAEAVAQVKAMPRKPAFLLDTGDITHLSKPKEFDDADQLLRSTGLELHVVPGEHDILDPERSAFRERYGRRGEAAGGWYSFDAGGVHFVGLVNVADLQAGGMGSLGEEQLRWLASDLKRRSAETPIVLFAHIPLWTVYPEWGWGTADSARALAMDRRFGSVTVLNGHVHQVLQKVEGNVTFHSARSTAFPQPAPGAAPSPGPMQVPPDQLRGVLGVTQVSVRRGTKALAIVDQALA